MAPLSIWRSVKKGGKSSDELAHSCVPLSLGLAKIMYLLCLWLRLCSWGSTLPGFFAPVLSARNIGHQLPETRS
jgi:hypothetical protein